MGLKLLRIHETEKGFIYEGEQEFLKRIKRFVNFDIQSITLPKKFNQLPPSQLKQKEADEFLRFIQPNDYVLLLDEKGKQFSSVEFANYIDKTMAVGGGNLLFCIGGAFGFHEMMYKRANAKLSLSKMTTSHQLVRIFFLEQLYRAFTIIHNHPYHNE